jgi:hypothetical protein
MSKSALEFAVFCIEAVARRLGTSGSAVYDALAVRSTLLGDYVVANYDALHTRDREYVVDDILAAMARAGVAP